MAVIYFLTDSLSLGGVTTFITTLAAALQQRGHRVSVLVQEGERVTALPAHWPNGVALEMLPVNSSDTRASYNRKLRTYLTARNVEVVLFNNCFYADAYLLRGTAMRGIFIVHNSTPELPGAFSKEGFYCADIVAPAPVLAARFKAAFPNHFVHCIPHGTTVPPVQAVKTQPPFKIAYLGRISLEKGVDKLPAILKPLLQSGAAVEVTITGSLAENPVLAQNLQEAFADFKKQVHFAGAIQGPGVVQLLQEAHVLLLPSREEAFGLAAIEGAARGAVPVISLLPGVTSALFANGEEAFLCEPEDIAAFTRALETLCRQPRRREAMAKAAYERAASHFSIEVMADAYEALILKPAPAGWVPPAGPHRLRQRAFALYRHGLFLKARKALAGHSTTVTPSTKKGPAA